MRPPPPEVEHGLPEILFGSTPTPIFWLSRNSRLKVVSARQQKQRWQPQSLGRITYDRWTNDAGPDSQRPCAWPACHPGSGAGLQLSDGRFPRELSGGQRQRVVLARAIIRRHSVFLMDDPRSSLDTRLHGHMRAELKHMRQSMGITAIYVTRDQIEAMTLTQRVAVLDKGIHQRTDGRSRAGHHRLERRPDLAEGIQGLRRTAGRRLRRRYPPRPSLVVRRNHRATDPMIAGVI